MKAGRLLTPIAKHQRLSLRSDRGHCANRQAGRGNCGVAPADQRFVKPQTDCLKQADHCYLGQVENFTYRMTRDEASRRLTEWEAAYEQAKVNFEYGRQRKRLAFRCHACGAL